jgi:hypothetical protein
MLKSEPKPVIQSDVNESGREQRAERDIASHVFGNSPTLLALCLTVIGLIKIYASLQRITTLADNLLFISVAAFLVATIFSYMGLRSKTRNHRRIFGDIADWAFMSGLCLTTFVALFITFTLVG